MIYLFVFNYFCFRVHYLLTSAPLLLHGPLAKGAGMRILYVYDVTEGLALCAVLSTHEIVLYLRR